ncbi:hypothetical protein K439DRAFT_1536430 [Ramaria rubella]|nr:hypothetical protein K439DRAFT_1536430 [Ramaria rubella]
MTELHIFTSLVVPVTTNGPSLTTLQWSEDGQAFVVTRSAIYILTPSTGIKFDPSSVITASLAQSTNKNVKGDPLSWYRNMIELEKAPMHHWPLESQDWGTVSLGSLDMSWSAITLSPSNLSKWSCCVMVALNTNLEVSLWAPAKNHLTGEWVKVQDITQVIKDSEKTLPTAIQKTLNAQVHSISWSHQISFGDRVCHDGSLLALGNRAGRVIFLRLPQMNNDQELQAIASLDVADDWVTQLAWSSWTKLQSGCFKASLACGIADGGIVIVLVSLFLDHDPQRPGVHPRFTFTLAADGRPCCLSDGSALTALTWVESKFHAPILVYSKPGVIHLQRMSSDLPLAWDGDRALALQLHPVSSSSTPFAAVSGCIYYAQHDALQISLYDGSFHTIHSISSSPTLVPFSKELITDDLTSQVRAVFSIAQGKVNFSDACRMAGVLDYDSAGTVGWLHEKDNPDDFSYKHDAKHSSIFIITRLWREERFVLEHLASLLHTTNFNAAPTHALRGIYLHLREKKFIEAHQARILELLQPEPFNELASYLLPPTGIQAPISKLDLRQTLASALFMRNDIYSCRLKLGVAMQCSVSLFTLSDNITCFQMRAVLRHFDCFVGLLEEDDRDFVRRWIIQCLMQRAPHIQQEATFLANRLGISDDLLAASSEVQEHCPACQAVIPLGTESSAVCPNGHVWARCSVTSFILATPFVRTCVGCCRKALLPLSQRPSPELDGLVSLPPSARSWLVQELLEAAYWCTFCGNRFVRVL